ncbi:hypothetical protein ADN00_17420 [Ornatilinea apprima]|uniref:Flavoprotein n=1 Tax=Ornatilinea apprima TaxID=1134406 RepID=A0A0P6XA47_9CHLR|nr:NAD(P)/FAD-dependent oxidoreductase [Ornatilinea apprima]KPL71461.1 hypothetical protein ADN00_17420 [Ornatilinea apprima]
MVSDLDRKVDLLIIGGGPAGFFGALACKAARPASSVLILEKSAKPLSKVLVSGGGRCNLTNATFDPAQLVHFYPRGGKALRGAFSRFAPQDTMQWFESHGVALKTEADGRVFPVSDDARTIVQCLLSEAERAGVELRTHSPVEALHCGQHGFQVRTSGTEILHARTLLLATGGDRNSFALAAACGHTLIPPVPSLFSFAIRDTRLEGLAGLSAENAEIRLAGTRLQTTGPFIITHTGISGPAVLKLSAWAARELNTAQYQMDIFINFLPGFNPETLYPRLLEIREQNPDQTAYPQALGLSLPRRLWARLLAAADIAAGTLWRNCSNTRLYQLAQQITRAEFHLQGRGEFKDEFVTAGGVDLNEVDFRAMQSKLVPGLFFAGEVLNIDGLTGGFNFQNAWTTSYIAGQAVADYLNRL